MESQRGLDKATIPATATPIPTMEYSRRMAPNVLPAMPMVNAAHNRRHEPAGRPPMATQANPATGSAIPSMKNGDAISQPFLNCVLRIRPRMIMTTATTNNTANCQNLIGGSLAGDISSPLSLFMEKMSKGSANAAQKNTPNAFTKLELFFNAKILV